VGKGVVQGVKGQRGEGCGAMNLSQQNRGVVLGRMCGATMCVQEPNDKCIRVVCVGARLWVTNAVCPIETRENM